MKWLTPALSGVILLACASASALTLTSTVNTALPSNDPAGIVDTIDTTGVVTGSVHSVFIQVTMDHTWVGDLALELTSPDGTELQIMARPGSPLPDEQTGGSGGCGGGWGHCANLVSGNPITFQDGAATSAEDLGLGLANGDSIPASTYFAAANGWSTDITSFAGFIGETAGGGWSLKVADYANGDDGTFVSWSLVIAPEPTTGLLMALGLIGLAITGRRRSMSHNGEPASALPDRLEGT